LIPYEFKTEIFQLSRYRFYSRPICIKQNIRPIVYSKDISIESVLTSFNWRRSSLVRVRLSNCRNLMKTERPW